MTSPIIIGVLIFTGLSPSAHAASSIEALAVAKSEIDAAKQEERRPNRRLGAPCFA